VRCKLDWTGSWEERLVENFRVPWNHLIYWTDGAAVLVSLPVVWEGVLAPPTSQALMLRDCAVDALLHPTSWVRFGTKKGLDVFVSYPLQRHPRLATPHCAPVQRVCFSIICLHFLFFCSKLLLDFSSDMNMAKAQTKLDSSCKPVVFGPEWSVQWLAELS
jgi:hypothetical protein